CAVIHERRKEWRKEFVQGRRHPARHEQEGRMAGRKPELNWTRSRGQYTTTIAGEFHLLGTDKEEAERLFRFLLNKHDLGEPADTNPTFAQVVDQWLDHVHQTFDSDRYRLCKARLEEFVSFVGEGRRVKDIRARHVEGWIASKTGVKKP